MLGIEGTFLAKIAQVVINESKDGYSELEEKKDFILKVLTQEEEKFAKTIDQGLSILSDMEAEMQAKGEKVLSGEDAFKLYDTYGFPIDLTSEILEEKGFSYDEKGFEACMEKQRQTARGARKETNYMGADANVYNEIESPLVTEFTGYDRTSDTAEIAFLTTDSELVEALSEGDRGSVITAQTPFYATMGGQQGDKGVITTESGTFVVEDTVKVVGNRYAHVGYISDGMIRTGQKATLSVDETLRAKTCRNHSATHLLQKALREVLGTHVEQAGSYQDSERTRFDFSHFTAMTPDELKKVEQIVNEKIAEGIEVRTDVMTVDEAKKTGAMALFGEKYGEKVRVVSMGDFSKEFCDNVLAYYAKLEEELQAAAKAAKTTPANLVDRIEKMNAEIKALQSENESLKSKAAKDALGDVMDQIVEVKGVKLLATSVSGVDMNGLRDLGDQLKGKLGEGVVVLASDCDGKVNLIAMATDGAQKAGAHAGNLIKAIAGKVGGGGGGRPNMAQAGGKNPSGIPDAIAEAKSALEGMLA
jgi:alanyl-tRNA synthetase